MPPIGPRDHRTGLGVAAGGMAWRGSGIGSGTGNGIGIGIGIGTSRDAVVRCGGSLIVAVKPKETETETGKETLGGAGGGRRGGEDDG